MGQSTNIGQQNDANTIGAANTGITGQNAQLNAQYSGMNPGASALQTAATNNAIQQSAGLVSSQKGISPALAARMAGQNAAQQTQQGANQAAQQANSANLQAQGLISQNLAGVNSNAQSGINQINSSNASTNNASTGVVGSAVGGLLGGVGAALYKGGAVPSYAYGGDIAPQFGIPDSSTASKGASAGGQAAGKVIGKGLGALFGAPSATPDPGPNADAMASSNAAAVQDAPQAPQYAKGGRIPDKKVPAMVSPGERYLPPKKAAEVAKGKANPMKAGEKIPGKAAVKGDSPKNDTVPKTLEAGGVVIPRSVLDAKNPHKEASKFVAAALMHHKLTRKYGK